MREREGCRVGRTRRRSPQRLGEIEKDRQREIERDRAKSLAMH